MRVGTSWSLRSFPTQAIIWYYNMLFSERDYERSFFINIYIYYFILYDRTPYVWLEDWIPHYRRVWLSGYHWCFLFHDTPDETASWTDYSGRPQSFLLEILWFLPSMWKEIFLSCEWVLLPSTVWWNYVFHWRSLLWLFRGVSSGFGSTVIK